MPINFFDSISLDKQEIQSVAIENLAADPGSPASGQIYFNTGTDAIRYYDGAAWIELDGSGGVTSVLAAAAGTSTGTVIVVDPVAGTGSVTLQPMAYDGAANVGFVPAGGTAGTFLEGDGTWGTPTGSMTSWDLDGDGGGTTQTITDGNTVTIAGGTALTTVASATDILTVNHDTFGTANTYAYPTEVITNSTGHITSITGGSAPTDTTYTLPASGTTSAKITLTPSTGASTVVNFTSTANQVTLTESAGTTITATLPDVVIAPGSLSTTTTLTSGGVFTASSTSTFTGIATFTALPTIPETPTAATDAASKGYVDSVLVGALVFQGGYNATTAAPTGVTILQGFTYVVTTAGDDSGFWPTTLEVGDVIIAEQDNPTVASDWTDVQNNIDLASNTVTGIASFPTANGFASMTGGEAKIAAQTPFSTIGSATEVSTVTTNAFGAVTAATATAIAIPNSSVTDFATGVDTLIDAYSYASDLGTNAVTQLTHSLGTRDVRVEIYRTSTPWDTVFAKVERNTVNQVTVTFSSAPGAGAMRCIITKIA